MESSGFQIKKKWGLRKRPKKIKKTKKKSGIRKRPNEIKPKKEVGPSKKAE
jgi:hypothetical protein